MALKYTTIHRKIHLLDWDLGRNLVNFTGSIDEDKKKSQKKIETVARRPSGLRCYSGETRGARHLSWPVMAVGRAPGVHAHDRSKNGDGREAVELVGHAHDMGELLSPIGS